jgi:hypothetical protein
MRILNIALITVLLMTSTFQACCPDCMAAIDAHTAGTSTNSVKSEAAPAGHFCASVWNAKDGYCADPVKLTAYAAAFKTAIETMKTNIKAEMAKVDVSTIKTKLAEVTTAMGTPELSALGADIKTKLTETFTAAGTMLEKPADVEKAIDTCYEAFIKFREEVLCHRTSGIADTYWDASTKTYKVNHNSCNKIVRVCSKALAAIAMATKTMNRLRFAYITAKPLAKTGLSADGTIKATDNISPL